MDGDSLLMVDGEWLCVWISTLNVPGPSYLGLTWFNLVNIMAADALAPYVAKTSAAIILTV